MQATFKEHGYRWLILIFILVMLGALSVSVRFLVEDTHQLQGQITNLEESQQLLQKSVLSTQGKTLELEKQVGEQERLITELENLVNYRLDN